MKEVKGKLLAQGMRFGIVISRFNELITKSLLEGALDGLERHGANTNHITIAWVPGAFEIPVAAKQMVESGNYDAIICLGAIIRGATAHFEHVATPCAAGIAQLALESGLPVIFGVLTTESIEQAIERAGTKAGNKGYEAAQTAIEMISLMQQLEQGHEEKAPAETISSLLAER